VVVSEKREEQLLPEASSLAALRARVAPVFVCALYVHVILIVTAYLRMLDVLAGGGMDTAE